MSEKENKIETVNIDSKEFEREMTLVYLMFKKEILDNKLKSSYSQFQSIPVIENDTHLDGIHLQFHQIDVSKNHMMSVLSLWISVDEINEGLLNYHLNIKDKKQIGLKIKSIEHSIIMPSSLENMIQTSYYWNLKSSQININDIVELDYKAKLLIIGKIIDNDRINLDTDIHIENINQISKIQELDLNSIQLSHVVMEHKKSFNTQYQWTQHHVNIKSIEAKAYYFEIPKFNKDSRIISEDKRFIDYSSQLFNVNKLRDVSYNKLSIDKIHEIKFNHINSQEVELKYQTLEIKNKQFYIQNISENNINIDIDKKFIYSLSKIYDVEKFKDILYSLPNINKIDELKVNYINNHIDIKANQYFYMPKSNYFEDIPHIESMELHQQDIEKLEMIDFNEIHKIWNKFSMLL